MTMFWSCDCPRWYVRLLFVNVGRSGSDWLGALDGIKSGMRVNKMGFIGGIRADTGSGHVNGRKIVYFLLVVGQEADRGIKLPRETI